MLQVAAAFGGGLYLKQTLDAVPLPQLKQVKHGGTAFTLSMRVVAASVPGLPEPGFLSHQRPFLEAGLGPTKKETEFADFARGGDASAGPYAKECPWRFGDTLTFKARPEDVTGPGLKLSLKVRRDIILGPVQFEMRAGNVGEGCLEVRQRILAACVQERRQGDRGRPTWASPVLLVPLSHVAEGVCGAEVGLAEAVAHVALVFSLDTDPEPILAASQPQSLTRQLEDRVEGVRRWIGERAEYVERRQQENVDGVMRWLAQPSRLDRLRLDPAAGVPTPCQASSSSMSRRPGDRRSAAAHRRGAPEPAEAVEAYNPLDPPRAAASAGAGGSRRGGRAFGPAPACEPGACTATACRGDPMLCGPDLEPEGWVCWKVNGRTFWHNRALGPAPWEVEFNL